ncbi:hypothetical protein Emed_004427 [Eimeria media]
MAGQRACCESLAPVASWSHGGHRCGEVEGSLQEPLNALATTPSVHRLSLVCPQILVGKVAGCACCVAVEWLFRALRSLSVGPPGPSRSGNRHQSRRLGKASPHKWL